MSKPKYKRSDIQIIRLISTIMIVLCHIITYYTFIPGSQFLNQVFDVGVFVFLLISGFLYGEKTIENFKKWLLQRTVRICVPVALVSIVSILILLFAYEQKTNVVTTLVYVFNLQGLIALNSAVFSRFFDQIPQLGPLWFATVIMICYLMVPLLQKSKKLKPRVRIACIVVSAFIAGVIKFFTQTELMYFVTFALGYFMADIGIGKKKLGLVKLIMLGAITCAFQVGRLVLLIIADNSPVYLAFVPFSHACLALFIFVFVMEIYKKIPRVFDKICDTWVFVKLDKLSFYTYLTHGIFCMGATNVFATVSNLWLSTILFVVLTMMASILLSFADDSINLLLRPKIK